MRWQDNSRATGIREAFILRDRRTPTDYQVATVVRNMSIAMGYPASSTPKQQVFDGAFTGTAATGGFAGSTIMMAMRYGIARGLFSNEAGLGSAPMVHAAATTDHPIR